MRHPSLAPNTQNISSGIQRELLLVAICFVLTACAHEVPVYGLKPLYPETRMIYSDFDFVAVDSLQPTLQWESFPRPGDLENGGVDLPTQMNSVTYDLRIWQAATNDRSAQLIYERSGLPEPRHRIECPLEPDRRYLWTIRARFIADVGSRVTEWSKPKFGNLRRSNIVPENTCFRFKTPTY
jgi:hypothetical protein